MSLTVNSTFMVCFFSICVILIIVLVVYKLASKTIQVKQTRRVESFQDGVKMPDEIHKTLYSTFNQQERCDVIDHPFTSLSENAANIASTVLESQRLKRFTADKTGTSCYLVNDDEHKTHDMLMAGRSCSKQDPLFNHPFIERVYESKDALPGESAPVKKCVIQFNDGIRDPVNADAFWTQTGMKLDCVQIIAPIRQANTRLRNAVAKSEDAFAKYTDAYTTLTGQLIACKNQKKQCNERLTATRLETESTKKSFAECKKESTTLEQEYKKYYDMAEAKKQDLDVNWAACESTRGDLATRFGRCEDTLGSVRKDNLALRSTASALAQVKEECDNKLATCQTDVANEHVRARQLDANVKGMATRADVCEKNYTSCKSIYQEHIDNVSTPCSLNLSRTLPQQRAFEVELEECRKALRSEHITNVDLRDKLAKLNERIREIDPENARLSRELEKCRAHLISLQKQLDDCMGRLDSDIGKLQNVHIARMTEMSMIMIDKQSTTVGAFCSRPIIDPPAVTQEDKDQLITDIDKCKELMMSATADRDSWRDKFINEKHNHEQLQIAFNQAQTDRDFWRDRFMSKDACIQQHYLCEECADEESAANGMLMSFNDWVIDSKTYYTKNGDIKGELFGGGQNRITPKKAATAIVATKFTDSFPSDVTSDGYGDGVMPSFKTGGTRFGVYWESPAFAVKEDVSTTFECKLDDDLYLWVNDVVIWAGSWHAVSNSDRTFKETYTFKADKKYIINMLWYNVGSSGYAEWKNGARELREALDDKKVVFGK